MASSPSRSEDPNTVIDSLLEDKQKQLREAKSPEFGNAILRIGTGALAGVVSGFTVVTAGVMGLFGRIMTRNPELKRELDNISAEAERLEKIGSKNMPQYVESSMKKWTDKLLQATEKEITAGPPSGIIKHSGKWVVGLTAAGAGLGYLWHLKQHGQKTVPVRQEIEKLQRLKDGWQNSLATKEEKSIESKQER